MLTYLYTSCQQISFTSHLDISSESISYFASIITTHHVLMPHSQTFHSLLLSSFVCSAPFSLRFSLFIFLHGGHRSSELWGPEAICCSSLQEAAHKLMFQSRSLHSHTFVYRSAPRGHHKSSAYRVKLGLYQSDGHHHSKTKLG